MKHHFLSIDLEEKNQAYGTVSHSGIQDLTRITEELLDLMAELNGTATFFVLGETADKYRNLLCKISEKGHEIACHGFTHDLLHLMPEKQVKKSITAAKIKLEDITGKKVSGFRAPCWSIKSDRSYILDHLLESGFLYDSSLFPFKTWLYGSFSHQTEIHRLKNGLLEFPPAVFKLSFLRIPCGGGAYFRFYPEIIWKILYRKLPGNSVFYLHPWELFSTAHNTLRKFPYSLIQDYKTADNFARWKNFLREISFKKIDSYLETESKISV